MILKGCGPSPWISHLRKDERAIAIGASCRSSRSDRDGQRVFEQWQDIQNSIDFSRSIARMREIVAAPRLGLTASQAAAEQIRKRRVFHRDDDLPFGSTDGREDLDKIQRPIVIEDRKSTRLNSS